jgi:hypothetical protein
MLGSVKLVSEIQKVLDGAIKSPNLSFGPNVRAITCRLSLSDAQNNTEQKKPQQRL